MVLTLNNLTIRTARPTDAEQLCKWWNDGKIMAHAGFPNGLNEQPEKIRENIANNKSPGLHIIQQAGKPIGEMSYRQIPPNTTHYAMGNTLSGKVAEIGIKICDTTHQEKGIGTTLLAMFIDALFTYYGYDKIILDTNTNNKRAQHVYENKLNLNRVQVRENAWHDQLGNQQSAIDYEITKADWYATHTKKDEHMGGMLPPADNMNHNPRPQNATPTTKHQPRLIPAYLHLRQEHPKDHFATESITREAHWRGNWDMNPQISDTHLLVHKLRLCPSYIPTLHFIAEHAGKPVGHIMYCTSKIIDETGKTHEALTFGPLSVLPSYQGKGIGQALMRHTFEEAKHQGYRAVLIFGHPDYYTRVGFRPAAEFGITTHDGKSFDPFMAYPLYEGALNGITGRYHIDPAYEDLPQDEIIAFEKKFPPKDLHIPISISVLLDRLPPPAQKALESLKEKSLMIMQTKSEREIAAMEGMDGAAIETIRTVMKEHGQNWGKKREKNKMKICILMGSPRPKGNTAELCKHFMEELKQNHAKIEYITLHDKKIAPCLGCYKCQKVEGEYGCIQTDDMQAIVEKILQADVLVFATPIYTWQATPPIKAVMDRMYGFNKFYGGTPRDILNSGQSYALIATCGYDLDYGAGLLDEGIRRWCTHSGLPYLGMYAVRDEDDLASFQTEEAIQGARQFARIVLEEGTSRQ